MTCGRNSSTSSRARSTSTCSRSCCVCGKSGGKDPHIADAVHHVLVPRSEYPHHDRVSGAGQRHGLDTPVPESREDPMTSQRIPGLGMRQGIRQEVENSHRTPYRQRFPVRELFMRERGQPESRLQELELAAQTARVARGAGTALDQDLQCLFEVAARPCCSGMCRRRGLNRDEIKAIEQDRHLPRQSGGTTRWLHVQSFECLQHQRHRDRPSPTPARRSQEEPTGNARGGARLGRVCRTEASDSPAPAEAPDHQGGAVTPPAGEPRGSGHLDSRPRAEPGIRSSPRSNIHGVEGTGKAA